MTTAEALAVVREAFPYSLEDAEEFQMPKTLAGYAALALIEQRVQELERERDEWKRQRDELLGRPSIKAYLDATQRVAELELWIASDVARARGIAESMVKLPPNVRLEGIEENAAEITQLLDRELGGGEE